MIKNILVSQPQPKEKSPYFELEKYGVNITFRSLINVEKLTPQESAQIPLLLHCTNDVERIGDHTELIQNIISQLQENDLKFSIQAEKEYDLLHDKLAEVAKLSAELLSHCTNESLEKSTRLEKDIYQMLNRFENEHIARITRGDCRPQVGILYLELLAEIRKISRHLFNINERSEMFYENFRTNNN